MSKAVGNDMVMLWEATKNGAAVELFSRFLEMAEETARAAGTAPKRVIVAWDNQEFDSPIDWVRP